MRTEERLTLQDAADALGISEQTARRWIKSGKLKAYKPGLRYLVPASAIEELLEEQSPKAPSSSPKAPEAQDGEERRNAVAALIDEYAKLGDALFDRWEDELEPKVVELAAGDRDAFFDWLREVRDIGRPYISVLTALYTASTDSKLQAVIGMSPFMQAWSDLHRRIEEAIEEAKKSNPERKWTQEDDEQVRRLLEETFPVR